MHCTIVKANPDFEPEWQELDEGHRQRTCTCWAEDIYEPRADPPRPLTVTERDGYWWVLCSMCDYGWQVEY